MKFNLDIPKIGYFILYKNSGKILTNIIKKEQINEGFSEDDSDYVHVEISGGGSLAVGAMMPFIKMVDILKAHKNEYVKIVKYKANDYNIKRYKVAFLSATKCNLPYGLLSLIWFKINDKIFKKHNIFATSVAPFCSFLFAESLKKVYPESFNDPRNILPANFLDRTKFEIVWEGYLE
jgi:hypothetical protein